MSNYINSPNMVKPYRKKAAFLISKVKYNSIYL